MAKTFDDEIIIQERRDLNAGESIPVPFAQTLDLITAGWNRGHYQATGTQPQDIVPLQ